MLQFKVGLLIMEYLAERREKRRRARLSPEAIETEAKQRRIRIIIWLCIGFASLGATVWLLLN
jgi:glutathione S-transferase